MAIAIDWGLLGAAVAFYRSQGYLYVEAPWIEQQAIIEMTRPPSCTPTVVTGPSSNVGELVGSSEQSMIGMTVRKEIGPGWYVACTPCWRDEPVLDRYHQGYFMKVELFRNMQVGTIAMEDMMETAMVFFRQHVPVELLRKLDVEITPEGYDITLGGVEIGSYGYRSVNGVSWVYGTGLAEPRFSTIRGDLLKSSKNE